jgi:hypothetical protein
MVADPSPLALTVALVILLILTFGGAYLWGYVEERRRHRDR